jgi:hypothetical protein
MGFKDFFKPKEKSGSIDTVVLTREEIQQQKEKEQNRLRTKQKIT